MRGKLTIFGKRRGPYDRQQDSFLYQLVSACSYRDFPLERCNREKQPLVNNLVYRWSSIHLLDHHEHFLSFLFFLNLLKDRWKKKVRLLTQWGSLEFIRFLFPFPLPGFEESTEGWKFAFSLEGWCPRPRAQTVRSQCRPILFFRCNKGNRATIKLINYFLDIKERLLVKENKRKKGCNFINRCTPPCYRLGIRFYSVSKIFQKNQEFLLYRRGMKHPLENTLPRSYRRVNETTAEGKLYYHWSK